MNIFDNHPIIPVVAINDAGDSLPLAEALLEGGIEIIEITFRTAAAGESIRRIRKEFPDLLVGAGTIVTEDQAKQAVDTGSQFGLAPGTDPQTIRYFKDRSIPFIPGILSPTDIQTAYKMGCNRLKFFPAGAAGGPPMLNALSAPYKSLGIKFCPTGGVTVDNLNDYLSMDTVFAVGGTWLAKTDRIDAKDWSGITENARAAVAALEKP